MLNSQKVNLLGIKNILLIVRTNRVEIKLSFQLSLSKSMKCDYIFLDIDELQQKISDTAFSIMCVHNLINGIDRV